MFYRFYLTDEEGKIANECLFSDSYYANASKQYLYCHQDVSQETFRLEIRPKALSHGVSLTLIFNPH